MPLVSVILPCFNAAPYIGSAIESICQQTFQDWELLVVDDASTDNTVEIVTSLLDKKVRLLRLEQNAGYPAAMNEGIARSSGKLVARMDADDVSGPARLQEQIKALDLHPSAAFCGVARYRITPGGKMYYDKKKFQSYYLIETWDNLMKGPRIFTDPSVIIERNRIESVGGYRTFQKSGMDVDLWLRVMERYGSCITITAPLFGKRLEPGSIIFNPKTYLINQVPRVLARQRVESGTDDIQEGKGIDLESYIERGWIKEGDKEERIGLLFGSIVTCLWLRDWRGVRIYFTQITEKSNLSKGRIIFMIAKKTFQRMRNNPFVQDYRTV